ISMPIKSSGGLGWRPLRISCITAFLLLALVAIVMQGCASPASQSDSQILLFNGTGTSPNDVAAVKKILGDMHLSYTVVNSTKLDATSEAELLAYRLLIIPGGNYIEIGEGLKATTTKKIRSAVD